MKATQALKKISVALGLKVELEQMKLVDGVTILEAESFEPGAEVFIVMEEDLIPLAIGEYELEDGRMIIVEQEGIIANVTEGDIETPEEQVNEPAEAPIQQGADRMPKRIIESITHEQHFGKKKMEEAPEVTPEDVAESVQEAEAEITEEVVAIINELTPDTVTEADASELANDVITAITETITAMPEEVAAKAFGKVKKYGKDKMSEEDASVIEEAKGDLVSAVSSVVDEGTPDEVAPEVSGEIAQTIVDAVTEIVSEKPAELGAQLFRKEVKTSKIKNSAIQARVAKAKERIAHLSAVKTTPVQVEASTKAIKYNPENKAPKPSMYKISSSRPQGYMDKVLTKLFK